MYAGEASVDTSGLFFEHRRRTQILVGFRAFPKWGQFHTLAHD
ncbi:hypothetical protein Krac_9665 [Ktedonobacter racemifer DSM 44963]|uniref:Uncharacterized protein n=1 Tax=Ktedonobacter racemifer DSM 44963 TaxID=485913 RepID=D6TD99_KTERA|nr:hypothetical protein Krac_9665 [Ktedonobacter racemifer DSM 44963]